MQIDYTPDIWVTERYLGNTGMCFRAKKVLFSEKSPFQHVCIVETEALGKMLLNDGMFMLSERDEFVYHEMIAHVPLFAHPNPKKVLIIGGGDGGSAREVLRHKNVQQCVLVEIDKMVVDVCKTYLPTVSVSFQDPRLTLHIEDGVKFIRETSERFDVIIIDSTDPIGPAAPLFGKEFYENVHKHLTPDGIVISQSESPFYNVDVQKGLFTILHSIFPKVYMYTFHNLTYPGGFWSFAFSSPKTDPFAHFKEERLNSSGIRFQYYNKSIHRGAFLLPAFIQENLRGLLSPLE